MKVRTEHRIDCAANKFWELWFNPDFRRGLNVKGMAANDYTILEHATHGPSWTMRSKIVPKDNMPSFLKKLVGSTFHFEETTTYEHGSNRARVQMVPSALRDKVRMNYEVHVVPDGDNACKRVIEWDVEVKLFGVGGLAEKYAANEILTGGDAGARFFNQHIGGETR
jgi:hypothetical protein